MMKSQKGRVLQVGKFFFPDKGGIETVTKNIFNGFLYNNIQTDIICFKRSNGIEKKWYGSAFVLKCGSFSKLASTPISLSFFYWFLKLRNEYQVLHIHCPNPLAAIAAILFPVKGKVIVHWHSDVITHPFLYYFFRYFENRLLKRADLILTTTPVYAAHSTALKPYQHKCNYLLLSVDASAFSINEERVKEIRASFPGKKIVFSLGRFVYYKGYEYLVKSAKYLPDDYIILIGGGGPLREKLERLIKTEKCEDKVQLVLDIPQHDVSNYYSACDIFCLSSCEKTEAFGLVILEAMIFGKPVVATNIHGSGVPWVNVHGTTGLNVEPKNPEALAKGFMEIMNGDYKKFSEGARHRYNTVFTNEEMLKKLQLIYQELMETTPVIEEKELHIKAV